MTDHQEVEWQFDANDLSTIEQWLLARPSDSGVTVSPSSTDHLTDTYYDTDDWRCHRVGFALRVRQHGDEIEATLKAFKSQTKIAGLRSRREITQHTHFSLEFGAAVIARLGRRVVYFRPC